MQPFLLSTLVRASALFIFAFPATAIPENLISRDVTTTTTVVKSVEYASGHEAVTCTPYNLCSVLAWDASETYSLTYVCDKTPAPTPTVAPTCATYELCTGKAARGTSTYSITHVCRSGEATITISPSKNTGQVAPEVVTTGTMTITSTVIVLTSQKVTFSTPVPSSCEGSTSTINVTWGTPVGSSVIAPISTTTSRGAHSPTPTPPAFTGGADLAPVHSCGVLLAFGAAYFFALA